MLSNNMTGQEMLPIMSTGHSALILETSIYFSAHHLRYYLLEAKIPDVVAHRSPQYPGLPHDGGTTRYGSSTLHYSGASSSLLRSRCPVTLLVLVRISCRGAKGADLLRLAITNSHMGTFSKYR